MTITSSQENALVSNISSGQSVDVWIALDDITAEGSYRLSAGPETGSLISYSAWASTQPDNMGNEDCVCIWAVLSLPNNWNDVQCHTTTFYYVIEYECPTGYEFGASACQGCIIHLL